MRFPSSPPPRPLGVLALVLLCSSGSAIFAVEEAAPPPVVISKDPSQPIAQEDVSTTSVSTEPTTFAATSKMAPASGTTTVTELFEDAENGTSQVNLVDPSGVATLIQGAVAFEGDYSFHLTNPRPDQVFYDTSVEIIPEIRIGADTQLIFASKFALLSEDQVAKVQVSIDGGNSYPATIWSRPGAGVGVAGGGFESVAIDLGAYEGQGIHLRFILDFDFGSSYTGTSTAVGWFFDAITIGESATKPLYSIGDPTPLEQYNLELINRSRADALAEADRLIALSSSGGDPDVIDAVTFFEIDPADIRTQYEWGINNGYMAASAQPLAFNAKLIEAARLHTKDMLENNFQGHVTSSNPPTEAAYPAGAGLADRVTASNYFYFNLGESVYAYADGVIHAHAGFLIDWGTRNDSGEPDYNPAFAGQGMQNPPGHRFSNHNPDFKEIGIGLVEGSGANVGPFLVTQDFASPEAGAQFITGVVIADMDNDDFYDVGEGLGGILVTAEPADSATPNPAYRAVTTESGGYTLPVPGDGQYTVTFSHPKYGTGSANCNLINGENFKVDWIPTILHTVDFTEASSDPTIMELQFFDAGIDGTPRLETTSNLKIGFTEETGATLSPRNPSGYRTFSYEKPGTPQHFSRVVVE